MKIKLDKDLCYIAGMKSKWKGDENSIGVCTQSTEVQARFLEIAIKRFGEKAEKIKVEGKCAYFYNSNLSRSLEKKVIEKKVKLFTKINENSLSYIAGIVDSSVRIGKRGIWLDLDKGDELILENLGIHTKDGFVLNISFFIMLEKPFSVLLSNIRLPGNERDPR